MTDKQKITYATSLIVLFLILTVLTKSIYGGDTEKIELGVVVEDSEVATSFNDSHRMRIMADKSENVAFIS